MHIKINYSMYAFYVSLLVIIPIITIIIILLLFLTFHYIINDIKTQQICDIIIIH